MPFIGIPDPNHNIAKIYNQEVRVFNGGRLPALTVIDKDFKIRSLYLSGSPSDIPSDEDVLFVLYNLNKETGGNTISSSCVTSYV